MIKFIDIAFNPTYYSDSKKLDDVIRDSLENYVLPVFIGTNIKTNNTVFNLAYKYKLYCYIGLHPNDIDVYTKLDDEIDMMHELLRKDNERRIIGIGECGLDSFRSPSTIDIQKDAFKKIILEFYHYKLPFFLHLRESEENKVSDEFFDIVSNNVQKYNITCVVHSFTSSISIMEKLVDINCFIGINGISMKETTEIVKKCPLKNILLETDSPFCAIRKKWAGASHVNSIIKGRDNSPSYIKEICSAISSIKNIEHEIICSEILSNTIKLFKRIKIDIE